MLQVKDFWYKKAGQATWQQGVKKGEIPSDAIRGGNGTFLIYEEPPKVNFMFEENKKIKWHDFYSTIKENSTRRVTEKYCRRIYEKVSKNEYNSFRELEKAIICHCE